MARPQDIDPFFDADPEADPEADSDLSSPVSDDSLFDAPTPGLARDYVDVPTLGPDGPSRIAGRLPFRGHQESGEFGSSDLINTNISRKRRKTAHVRDW